MFRRTASAIATFGLAITLVSSSAAPGLKEPVANKRDREALQGTWYTVSTAHGSTESGEDRTDTITYQGDTFFQERGPLIWAVGTFRIVDANANPKQIEYTYTAGTAKGTHCKSIYTLDGDNHQICTTTGSAERPNEFSSKAGFLRVTKRERR